MRVGCMLAGIVDPLRSGQGVQDIKGADFETIAVDVSVFAESLKREKIYTDEQLVSLVKEPEKMEEVVTPFLKNIASAGIPVSMIVAPFIRPDRKDGADNATVMRLAKETVRIAVERQIPNVVVRPIFAGMERDAVWDINRPFFGELAKMLKGTPIKILIENLGRSVGGHLVRGICADEAEAVQWIDDLNADAGEDRFGICFNVGTCSLCGQNPYEVLRVLGKRVCAVIVSDNDGIHDATYLPFSTYYQGDQTDWLGVIRGLREIGFDGDLLIAMEESAKGISPMIRPHLMKLAKEIAEFFRWQLEIEKSVKKYPKRVLFGAGNMCINYMKNYGDQYPPLFTCDNNSARWGETFAGLEIHSPEDLRQLSEDTAIFICNVYYREIEAQIRKMGLKNPVEYFNDEYLPVLNMDRVDRVQEGMKK